MKRYILAISFLAISISALAQRRHDDQLIHAYPVIGATWSQIEGDELKGFKQMGFTGGVGALVNLRADEMLKLSVEATYSQRGTYNGTGNPYNFDLRLNYVDIPITLHFQDPIGGMNFGIGLGYSRLVEQPHGSILFPNNFIPDTTDMSFLRNDLAIIGDLRFTIWRGLKMNIRYQYSLFPIKKQWHLTEYTTEDLFTEHVNDLFNSSVSLRIMYVFGDDGSIPKASKYHHKSYHKKSHRW